MGVPKPSVPILIIFVLGGVTFSETRAAYEVSRQLGCEIFIGKKVYNHKVVVETCIGGLGLKQNGDWCRRIVIIDSSAVFERFKTARNFTWAYSKLNGESIPLFSFASRLSR